MQGVTVDPKCLVIAGRWICENHGGWHFQSDKKRMSVEVFLSEGMTLKTLRKAVQAEFEEEDGGAKLTLSYWCESLASKALKKETPPIILRTDASVASFCKRFLQNKVSNLYAGFEKNEDPSSFVTPCNNLKRKSSCIVDGVNRANDVIVKETEDPLSYVTPCNNPKRKTSCIGEGDISEIDLGSAPRTDSSVAMNNNFGEPVGLVDVPICMVDDAVFDEIEAAEELCRSVGRSVGKTPISQPSWDLGLDDDEDSDESGSSDDLEEVEVIERGYDRDFWEPFLNEDFGGSNAIDIMCNTVSAIDDDVVTGGVQENEDFGKSVNQVNDGAGSVFGNGDVSRGQPLGIDFGQPVKSREVVCGRPYTIRCAAVSNEIPVPAGGTCVGAEGQGGGDKFRLHDIEDDQFDIPPLYDDTTYKMADVPDLEEMDDRDANIVVGKTYINKVECQIALAIFAIRNMFHFKQTRTKKDYFVVSCSDVSCPWKVNAHKVKESEYYQIRKAYLEHTCTIETRSKFIKMATAKVIAHVYKGRYGDVASGPTPKDLQQLVLEDLRVNTSYFKCWRAKETANEGVRGTEEDAYLKLDQYLHLLTLANPGTRTDIETEIDEDGGERFLYLFLAFGASIEGFRNLRKVLVLDGTHLTGKYKGVLLTASGQDANFQVFPLAFAVVNSENDDSWRWFLTRVEKILADSPSLSIISDRHKSILKASKEIYKMANHGACVVHLARNVVARYKSRGLAKLVVKAASVYTPSHFKKVFRMIEEESPACAQYLTTYGLKNWTRAYFGGERYNLMTSNIAEALNNVLKKAKSSPITELIMFIQAMLTRWFCARRKKSVTYDGAVTPEVDKLIMGNLARARATSVTEISHWTYEVQGLFGHSHIVQLDNKQCHCRGYDKLKIPCGHALLAANKKGLTYGPLTGEFYRTSAWVKTYGGVIQPHEEPIDDEVNTQIHERVLLPPKTIRPVGRPKVKRFLSTGEIPDKKTKKKCSRCGLLGHNKKSCRNAI